MTDSENPEGQKAVGVVLDMVEAMRCDDKDQFNSIVQTYISSASSDDEKIRLLGILLQIFSHNLAQLTYVVGEVHPPSLEHWRNEMLKIAGQE
jgi:hypothetical protein